MSAAETLRELGGVATWSGLRRRVSRSALAYAVGVGDIVVDARGRYALPGADEALRAASRLGGTVSHRSAAQHWGWAQKALPAQPEIILPKHRRPRRSGERVVVRWADLTPDEVDGRVTTRERTVIDCLRTLELDAALAVADSALRSGDLSADRLLAIAAAARGPGSVQCRRMAGLASPLAANPFESVLRSLAWEAGLRVRPQVPLYGTGFLGRPDLVDTDLRVVLEADSFTWHGSRPALRRDARRYNALVVHGWLVLRFAWEDVMHDQAYVRSVLAQVAQGWTERRCWACGHA